jgi:hypothetical protein
MNAANCFTFIATSHAPVSYLAYACRSSEREQPRIDVPELLRIVESPEGDADAVCPSILAWRAGLLLLSCLQIDFFVCKFLTLTCDFGNGSANSTVFALFSERAAAPIYTSPSPPEIGAVPGAIEYRRYLLECRYCVGGQAPFVEIEQASQRGMAVAVASHLWRQFGDHFEAPEGDAAGTMIFVLPGVNGSFLQLDRKSHRIIWCHRDNCRAQPKPEAGRRETDVHVPVRCSRGCMLRQ